MPPHPTLSSAKNAQPFLWFAALACLVVVLERNVAHNARLFDPPFVLYGAIVFDLTFFVPFLYWVIVVRPRKQNPMAVLPFFLGGLLAASLLLPTGQQSVLRVLRLVAAPAEIVTFGGAAWLIIKALRRFRTGGAQAVQQGDWGERLHVSLDAASGEGGAVPIWVRAFCDEIVMVYFALAAWRVPTPPAPPASFTYHHKSGWSGILGGILAMMAFEMPAEHYLIGQWNRPLAWVLAASSVYGFMWLWADFQAIRLRPIVFEPDGLLVRIGLRWRVFIPYPAITELRHVLSHPTRKVPGGHLKAVVWGQPNLRLHLSEPVIAHGPMGISRTVQHISLSADEPEAFACLLREKAKLTNEK